jgi:hypothetical protein
MNLHVAVQYSNYITIVIAINRRGYGLMQFWAKRPYDWTIELTVIEAS